MSRRFPQAAALRPLLALALLGAAAGGAADQTAPVQPLPQAHAHNDYEHPRPLHDALDHGFLSIEADIHLVDGELLVAHDREDVRPDRTLRRLYLEPLRKRLARHRGRVYADHAGPLLLLIDIKTAAEPTYAELARQLRLYESMLTTIRDGRVRRGPVRVVISGNRPIATVQSQPLRHAGIDGRFSDLNSDLPAHLLPLISDNARKHFEWTADGRLSATDTARLRRYVAQAHARGRQVRLWATPDHEGVWDQLLAAGVDLLNTDDLPRLRAYLLKRRREAGQPPHRPMITD